MPNPLSPIPLLDYIGNPIFTVVLLILLGVQQKFPLRAAHFSVFRRLVRNFVFSAPALVLLRLALIPIPLGAAWWVQSQGFGLFHWFHLPGPIALVIGLLVLDWAYYWWHYALHLVPFLWRFHNVHHTDLDLDVSTAARFHFGEIIASIPFRVALVLLLGIGPLTLVVFELIFEAAVFFQHSNWRLPLLLERALNCIIVTPRMHGIHHSIVQRETNSNWGTIFSCWDRVHRSLRVDLAQEEIEIGVASYRDERELTLARLWIMPFGQQRPWRLPDGTIPEREPRPVRQLQP